MKSDKKLKNCKRLHLGCGKVRLNDFINIDIAKTPAVDRIMDISKLDYPDNSIELVYASHVLEHFPQPKVKVPMVLKEWYRVLKSEGGAVIVVPNFDRCVDWYTLRFPFRHLKYIFLRYILGLKNVRPGRELTDNFIADIIGGGPDYKYTSYHKILFNPESFEVLAKTAGFRKIQQIDLESGDFPIPQVDPKKLHWSSMAFSLYK